MMYLNLFYAFFKIGLFGFGGGMAIISLIYDSIQVFSQLNAAEFADIVAISQVTPGPLAVNTATYIGYDSAGVMGSFFATFGVVLPAFILVIIVVRTIDKYNSSTLIQGALQGVRPATVGMMATAAITIGIPAFTPDTPLGANIFNLYDILPFDIDPLSVLICIVTVIAIGKFKVSTIKILITMGIFGAVISAF